MDNNQATNPASVMASNVHPTTPNQSQQIVTNPTTQPENVIQTNQAPANIQQQQQLQNNPSNAAPNMSNIPSSPIVNTNPTQTSVSFPIGPPTKPPQTQPIQPLLAPDETVNVSAGSTAIQVPNANQSKPTLSPQRAIITKVKLAEEIFDWSKTALFLNQIAEKAKSSVDSLITTLDPGMKEYLYSGGNINIVVISHLERSVSPVRDAFQCVFGRATVASARNLQLGQELDYPIKLACGSKGAVVVAKERIRKLRHDNGSMPQNQVVVVVQPTLVTPFETESHQNNHSQQQDDIQIPKWFLTYCAVLEDPVLNLTFTSFSQMIQIEDEFVARARETKFPPGFNGDQLGFARTIDDLMNQNLQLTHQESESEDCTWLYQWTGLSELQILRDTAISLAHMYKRKWDESVLIKCNSDP